MSDLHIEPEGIHHWGHLDGYAATMRVFEHIKDNGYQPAFFVVSGDLVQGRASDDDACYARLNEVVDLFKTTFDVPVLLALGNGDVTGPFRRVVLGEANPDLDQRYYYSETINDLKIIVLDSHDARLHGGNINPEQLAWLQNELVADPEMDHVIVLHHTPSLAVVGRDTVQLSNASELAAVLEGHKILGVLSGHVHMAYMSHFAGFPSLVANGICNSSNWSYARDQRHELLAPGYSLVHVRDRKLLVQFLDVPGERPTMAWGPGYKEGRDGKRPS